MANTNTNASRMYCIRLAMLVRKAMSQPSVGKTLAPYSAESKINVRLIARGHKGGLPKEYLGSDRFGGAYALYVSE